MKHEVVDDAITHDEHNWTLQSLHRLSGRELSGGPYVLRVVVKRNAYDFQSYATIQVWSGLSWKEVWTLPRSQMSVLFVLNGREVAPYAAQVLSKEAEDAFHADEAALLSIAKDILS